MRFAGFYVQREGLWVVYEDYDNDMLNTTTYVENYRDNLKQRRKGYYQIHFILTLVTLVRSLIFSTSCLVEM